MLTFLVCLGLVLTGIAIVYNKGKRPQVTLSGLIEEKSLVDYGKTHSKLKGYLLNKRGFYMRLSVKIDEVGDQAFREELMGRTVIMEVDRKAWDLIKEGQRVPVSLNRFVSLNGQKHDQYVMPLFG